MKNIIFIGPPASGKGAMSKILSKEYGIPHISTGDLFREQITLNTKFGIYIKENLDKGDYIPFFPTMATLFMRLGKDDCINGYILDGFPRTIEQAIALEEFYDVSQEECKIFELDVSTDILVDRMINRGRSDDKDDVFITRIKKYHDLTKPVVDFYRQKNKLTTIPASGSVEDVAREIKSHLVDRNVSPKVINFPK
jgi:adenylate kinase